MSRADLHCHSAPGCSPLALYSMAKGRGMDFVTVTDRDSIEAVLSIADRDDVFVSVELSAQFRDGGPGAQVLCHGISVFDHVWLQRHRDDLSVCLAYLHEHSIAHAFVEPTDACGADIGRRYTETPAAETPWEFLAHLRGRAGEGAPLLLAA
jgi:hypothetical protein